MARRIPLPRRRSPGTAARIRRPVLALMLTLLAAGCADRSQEAEQQAPDTAPAAPTTAAERPIDLREVGYDRGHGAAPVLVIEFSDYGCPYCGRFALETFPALSAEFIEAGTVRWKYVPIVLGTFPNGEQATRAAECAAEQGEDRFWAMSRLLYTRQQDWRESGEVAGLLRRWARELGLDDAGFRTCYDQYRPRERMQRSNAAAAWLGVQATPTFFVNGMRVQGALPVDRFRQVLRSAAGEAGGSR